MLRMMFLYYKMYIQEEEDELFVLDVAKELSFEHLEGEGSSILQGCELYFQLFFAIIRKRFDYVTRNWKGLLSLILLLAIFVCIAMTIGLTTPHVHNQPPYNSRPLNVEVHKSHIASITPNHLLTLKTKVLFLAPGNFTRADVYVYSRKRWPRVQYVADLFRSRHRKEYLNTPMSMQKWLSAKSNFAVNVVLIKDDGAVLDRPVSQLVLFVEASPPKVV